MESKITYQKLRKENADKYEKAIRYYSVLSVLNDLELTERELQLVAYTAVHGNMSYASVREDFCKKYNTTPPTINNMISKIKKKGVLIKDNGKIKVNPSIALNFDNSVILHIYLENGQTI